MTLITRFGSVSMLAALGALAGACALVLGIMVYLNIVSFRLTSSETRQAQAEITGKHADLLQARIGRQYQPSEIQNLLGYRFRDAAGIEHAGQLEVSILQFNAYAVGNIVPVYYISATGAAVSLGQPPVAAPQSTLGLVLVIGGILCCCCMSNAWPMI